MLSVESGKIEPGEELPFFIGGTGTNGGGLGYPGGFDEIDFAGNTPGYDGGGCTCKLFDQMLNLTGRSTPRQT